MIFEQNIPALIRKCLNYFFFPFSPFLGGAEVFVINDNFIKQM